MTQTQNISNESKFDRKNKADSAAKKHIANTKNLIEESEKSKESHIEIYRKIAGTRKVVNIPTDDIVLDENIRKSINTESSDFLALLASIHTKGILQNIAVEFRDFGDDYQVICIAGHRRVTAARIANLDAVPAMVTAVLKKDDRVEMMLAENLIREDLHCLEVATGYKELLRHGWSREKLTERFGKTDRTIQMYLKMASWPQSAETLIRSNPEIFTARNLTRKVACRKFDSDKQLMEALNALVKPKPLKSQPGKLRKEVLAESLKSYLAKRKHRKEIKTAIVDAFKEFNLIV